MSGLESLVMLSKLELRSTPAEIKLPGVVETSKNDMIKSVSGAILNNDGDTTNGILALIDEEGKDEDTV